MPMEIHSLTKALDILEHLSAHPESGVNEIARALTLDNSTVSRQLAALEARGYVLRNTNTGKFRLGYKVLALGRRVEEQLDLRMIALPVMRKLRDDAGHSVAIFVRHGFYRVCVEQVQGRDPLRRIYAVGELEDLWPLGSIGRILVAYMPQEEQEALFASLSARGIPVDNVRRDLPAIRAAGVAFTRSERLPGAAGVSAPIFDGRGACIAALNVGGPTTRFTDKTVPRLLQLVAAAANEISRFQGWSGNSG